MGKLMYAAMEYIAWHNETNEELLLEAVKEAEGNTESKQDDVAYIVEGICSDCGQEIAEDWVFCPGCGRRLMA